MCAFVCCVKAPSVKKVYLLDNKESTVVRQSIDIARYVLDKTNKTTLSSNLNNLLHVLL